MIEANMIKKIFVLFALFAFLFLLTSTELHAEQNSWHYPLEIKVGVSSTFGEFRGNRVHTGVDLRTNMTTGYKVYAIDDGTITRISVKKLGFGKAIYIEHPNGLMSVYGHLDHFDDKTLGLEKLVRQYQKQRGTKYPGNIYPKIPVKRGQLIAYSGETGYGLPHLHFEVRRGGATPIDPFKHGFEYEDKTPPVIEGFIIDPLGSQSYLDGEHFSREYRTEQQQGKYLIKHTPRIHGKVRFTVAAYDQIGAANKCNVDRIDLYIAYSAVNKLDMYIDKDRFFSNQFNWVTYETDHRGGLVYDYNLTRLSNPTQYYYRLYNISPAHFPFREVFALNNGTWDTTTSDEGLHTITVEAYDVGGNMSVAQMQVYVEKQPSMDLQYSPLKEGWKPRLRDFHDFLEVVCQSAESLREAPTLQIARKGNTPVTMELLPRGSNLFSGTYDLTPGQDGIVALKVMAITEEGQQLERTWQVPVNTIFAKRGGIVRYGDKASMSFPPGALYEDIFANIFPARSYEETPGLPLISEVFDFRPAGCPLEKQGTIRIQYPATIKNPGKLGIFWWDTIKKRWYFMDDKRESKAHNLTAKIIYPSIYAILQDNVNPVISDLVPESGSTVSTAHSALSAIIKDVGKGIDETSIVMKLDEKRVDGEYDPDRNKFAYTLTGKLKSGTHTLTVQAADKAGNQAEMRTSKFTVK
jgi:hypothetical protein